MGTGVTIRQAREKKGWSQAKLGQEVARLLGLPKPIKQQSIDAIEAGRTQKSRYENEILQVLGLQEAPTFRTEAQEPFTNPQNSTFGGGTLGVHAASEGGNGTMILSSDPVEFASLPDLIKKPGDGYGIIVVGESMVPEFRPHDTALVHKKLPPVMGEAAVFYSDDGHGTVLASIKTFLRETPTHWHVAQHNPKRRFTLSRKAWQTCHRVIGKYSRR
jgi:phage repressor protein C with HTH and peptisase S24 domain